MSQINSPFLLPKLRPIKELSPQENNYHEQIERIIQQIYRRVGGPIDDIGNDDGVNANENQIAQLLGLVGALLQRVEDLESDTSPQLDFTKSFNSITVTSNQTLASYDFANVKQKSTVKLPQYPDENSVIIVRNGDGTRIAIDPNGKAINGETMGYISRKGTALVLHYFIDTDEWLAR